jgi:hypothetical protein
VCVSGHKKKRARAVGGGGGGFFPRSRAERGGRRSPAPLPPSFPFFPPARARPQIIYPLTGRRPKEGHDGHRGHVELHGCFGRCVLLSVGWGWGGWGGRRGREREEERPGGCVFRGATPPRAKSDARGSAWPPCNAPGGSQGETLAQWRSRGRKWCPRACARAGERGGRRDGPRRLSLSLFAPRPLLPLPRSPQVPPAPQPCSAREVCGGTGDSRTCAGRLWRARARRGERLPQNRPRRPSAPLSRFSFLRAPLSPGALARARGEKQHVPLVCVYVSLSGIYASPEKRYPGL